MKGFVFVDQLVPSIGWDAAYASRNNFTDQRVDGYLTNRIVGTPALCSGLQKAQEKAQRSGHNLFLWDGYRPLRAVACFLQWSLQAEDGVKKSRHYPNISRSEMITRGYIAPKSAHSRGSTVDLTLVDTTTAELLPMGGGHDLMDPISHHGAKGITAIEARNRALLRSIMESSGFRAYPCEWWHYTLIDEPYPQTYFDFPVSDPLPTHPSTPQAGELSAPHGCTATGRHRPGPACAQPRRPSAGKRTVTHKPPEALGLNLSSPL